MILSFFNEGGTPDYTSPSFIRMEAFFVSAAKKGREKVK